MAQPKVKEQNQAFGCHPTTGAALTKEQSPAAGYANAQASAAAGLPNPCSVLGTGINADLIVNGAEAV